MTDRPMLLSPVKIRSLELRNRVVISPMCQYSAEDAMLTDWHVAHLGQFAMGGAGLVFTEATAAGADDTPGRGCADSRAQRQGAQGVVKLRPV